MAKKSAGILMYRFCGDTLQVFLVHPGGPFWANKDRAAWSIPKGEFDDNEDPFEAAKREFKEETGIGVEGDFFDLGQVKQSGGKRIFVWAIEGDLDPTEIVSNSFEMEWPPKSKKYQRFPEVDKAAWICAGEARAKLHKGQVPLIDRLVETLGA